MLAHRYLVFLGFIIPGIILAFQVIRLKRQGQDLLGKPSIDKFNFYTGKITLGISWILFLYKAIYPDSGYIAVPPALSWIAVGFLWAGSVVISIAIIDLGNGLKVGITNRPLQLKTNGIYRFSRNPLYVGAFLISLASGLYSPDLMNIAFIIYGICMHHQIILGEEQFLSNRFGEEWERYRKSVRRYL